MLGAQYRRLRSGGALSEEHTKQRVGALSAPLTLVGREAEPRPFSLLAGARRRNLGRPRAKRGGSRLVGRRRHHISRLMGRRRRWREPRRVRQERQRLPRLPRLLLLLLLWRRRRDLRDRTRGSRVSDVTAMVMGVGTIHVARSLQFCSGFGLHEALTAARAGSAAGWSSGSDDDGALFILASPPPRSAARQTSEARTAAPPSQRGPSVLGLAAAAPAATDGAAR